MPMLLQDDARLLERICLNPQDHATMLVLADCLTDLGRVQTANSWRWIGTNQRSPVWLSSQWQSGPCWMWQRVHYENWQRLGCNALPEMVYRWLRGGEDYNFQRRYQTIQAAFADLVCGLLQVV